MGTECLLVSPFFRRPFQLLSPPAFWEPRTTSAPRTCISFRWIAERGSLPSIHRRAWWATTSRRRAAFIVGIERVMKQEPRSWFSVYQEILRTRLFCFGTGIVFEVTILDSKYFLKKGCRVLILYPGNVIDFPNTTLNSTAGGITYIIIAFHLPRKTFQP